MPAAIAGVTRNDVWTWQKLYQADRKAKAAAEHCEGARMSRPRNDGSPLKDLAVVPGSGNGKPAARRVQTAFDGMIASTCDLGISIETFIELARLARMTDPMVARFLDAWDAISASEQKAKGAVQAVCERMGFIPVELLLAVADAAVRSSMCEAQLSAALSLPSIVERSIETALTPQGIADRKMLFQHSGFLPSPKISQTAFSAMRDANVRTPKQIPPVTAPRPEDTIRRVMDRFNNGFGVPRTSPPALPEVATGQTFPDTIPEDEEGDGE